MQQRAQGSALALAFVAIAFGFALAVQARAPNIVLIVADDGGYSDYGFSAALVGRTTANETPNLDALAQRSVIVPQAYNAAPVCGPSRAGLLTGQYQQRYGFEENLSNSAASSGDRGLTNDQITIAQRLKTLGYTTGAIGKWHQGYADGVNRPLDKGFDEFYGFLAGARSYWSHGGLERGIRKNNQSYETQYRQEGDPSKYDPVRGRYLTDAFGEEAVDFIDRHAEDDSPFFLYLPFTAPHTPYEAKQADYDRFAHIADPSRRAIAAQIYAMDRSIGEVLGALESNAIDDDTIVLFLNDNGAPPSVGGNYPYRGNKGTTWEGGIRTPLLVSGPGLTPGRYNSPVTTFDLLPTLVAAGGGDVAQIDTDGHNLLPQLTGQNSSDPHGAIFWRHATSWAVRKGDWKLAMPRTSDTRYSLYNLAQDPNELTTFTAANPQIVAELLSDLTHWEATIAKPKWGSLGTNNQNEFDHFIYHPERAVVANWSSATTWSAPGSANILAMRPADAYANAILEFTTRNDADYRATNDMKRMSLQTFMLNQIRLTGDFAGTAARRATIDGNAVLMVKNLVGQLPEIRLDTTSIPTQANYEFHWNTEIQLLDDVRIGGDGTEQFVVNGAIRDYYETVAPDHAAFATPHNVTKFGTSAVTLTGENTFRGTLTVEAGKVTVAGPAAAIRNAEGIAIGAAGALELASGKIAVDSFDNLAGGVFHFTGGQLEVGHYLGNLTNDGGEFSPDASPSRATISGDFTQTAGTLRLDLGGPHAGFDHNSLIIGGAATLGGVVDIRLVDDFAPVVGQTFQILAAAGGIESKFTSAKFPELPGSLSWTMVHDANTITLTVGPPRDTGDPLNGDYNADGAVDGLDYTVWRNSRDAIGSDMPADGDGNHIINEADFALWRNNYSRLSNTRLGDFNGDWIVDELDRTLWQDSHGLLGTDLPADANHDNVVDDEDLEIWNEQIGLVLPARSGDYNQDGAVDGLDYTVWRNSLGREGRAMLADGNGDFRIDQADFNYWKERYNPQVVGGGGNAAGVPEPATVALILSGMFCAAWRRGR